MASHLFFFLFTNLLFYCFGWFRVKPLIFIYNDLMVGARVMCIKNVDQQDGLVNGVLGVVREIVNISGELMPCVVVKFDDDEVGE